MRWFCCYNVGCVRSTHDIHPISTSLHPLPAAGCMTDTQLGGTQGGPKPPEWLTSPQLAVQCVQNLHAEMSYA